MILRFPYLQVLKARPIGPGNLTRPLVPVRLDGPSGGMRFHRALVDSGADWTLFPFDVAGILGIALVDANSHVSYRGARYPIRFGRATLKLGNLDGVFEWEADIGFTKAPIKQPLLGQIGCFDQFNIRFSTEKDPKFVEFEEIAGYQGRVIRFRNTDG